jgi:hypothetical protein
MEERIFDIVRLRLSNGYRITSLEGAAKRYELLGKIARLAKSKNAIAEDLCVN